MMPAVEAPETFSNKPLFPQSNRIDTAAHRPTGLGLPAAKPKTIFERMASATLPLRVRTRFSNIFLSGGEITIRSDIPSFYGNRLSIINVTVH
jgi:hypothetical protein